MFPGHLQSVALTKKRTGADGVGRVGGNLDFQERGVDGKRLKICQSFRLEFKLKETPDDGNM